MPVVVADVPGLALAFEPHFPARRAERRNRVAPNLIGLAQDDGKHQWPRERNGDHAPSDRASHVNSVQHVTTTLRGFYGERPISRLYLAIAAGTVAPMIYP